MIIKKEREDLEVFSFIFGLCIGSFLNVLILRLPLNQSILSRSKCPNCKHEIYWLYNIPLFSYLLLRTKCSNCKTKISFQYFLIEFLTAIITLGLFLKIGLTQEFIFMCLLSYFLIVLSFIDLKYKAVPDYMLLFTLIISFFATEFFIIESLKNAFLFAGAFVLLNFIITFYIQNIKSKILKNDSLKTQEALGEGDIPIIALLGIVLGVDGGLTAIFLAAFFAIIPAIYLNFVKKDIQTPFIPYLVLGFFTEYFFNLKTIIKVYY